MIGGDLPPASIIPFCEDSEKFTYEIRDGELWITYICAGLPIPLFSNEPAFNNFMIFSRLYLQNKRFPVLASGAEISNEFIIRISSTADRIAMQLDWQKGDLLMLNNTRFMHARPSVVDPEKRKIVTRFGYARRHPQREKLAQSCCWRQEGVIFSQLAGVISA